MRYRMMPLTLLAGLMSQNCRVGSSTGGGGAGRLGAMHWCGGALVLRLEWVLGNPLLSVIRCVTGLAQASPAHMGRSVLPHGLRNAQERGGQSGRAAARAA